MMESKETLCLVKKIIDRNIEIFLEEIRNRISVDNIAIGPRKSDFPIFEPANQDFFNYSFYGRNVLPMRRASCWVCPLPERR